MRVEIFTNLIYNKLITWRKYNAWPFSHYETVIKWQEHYEFPLGIHDISGKYHDSMFSNLTSAEKIDHFCILASRLIWTCVYVQIFITIFCCDMVFNLRPRRDSRGSSCSSKPIAFHHFCFCLLLCLHSQGACEYFSHCVFLKQGRLATTALTNDYTNARVCKEMLRCRISHASSRTLFYFVRYYDPERCFGAGVRVLRERPQRPGCE